MSIKSIVFTDIANTPRDATGPTRFKAYVKFILCSEEASIIVKDCRLLERTDEDGRSRLMLSFPDKMARNLCPCCRKHRNSNADRYCCGCGSRLRTDPGVPERIPVAHPTDVESRARIEEAIFAAYREHLADPQGYAEARACEFEERTGLSSRVRQLLRSEA